MAREFNPAGLPDYTLRQEVGQRGEMGWSVYTTAPFTFAWNEATQRHDVPEFRDWSVAWSRTAKGAVAAAHNHARSMRAYAA
jgi:hypothetical protein